ncbi:MAG TPA: c-type cytochrome [Gemmatimonadaceae bacterium]|nr:c-type cytochrome [Gemmatimonadaceae bacterium]
MKRKRWFLTIPAAALLAAFANGAGGWAIVSVQDLPDYAVAGQPVTLTYTVRQHAEGLLPNLNGTVIARSGSAKVHVAAKPMKEFGHYAATLTLPNAGDWTVTIESGFMKAKNTLLPIKVIAAGSAAPAPPAPDDRGRRLFVAKGCVTCHTHSDAKSEMGDAAPELTGKKFAPSYLAEFLANPRIKPSSRPDGWQMPNPHLKQSEIAPLIAFINSDKRVAVAAK